MDGRAGRKGAGKPACGAVERSEALMVCGGREGEAEASRHWRGPPNDRPWMAGPDAKAQGCLLAE